MKKLKGRKSLTLIECVLAMALAAMVVTSLFMVFRVVQKSCWLHVTRGDVLERLRLALYRMTTEIRYAEKILQLGDHVLEFETKYLEDGDEGIEVIKYEWISYELYRSVDGGTAVDMTIDMDTYFGFKGYKVDSGVFVDGATIDDAVAVGIDHSLKYQEDFLDFGPEYIQAISLVQLRNTR